MERSFWSAETRCRVPGTSPVLFPLLLLHLSVSKPTSTLVCLKGSGVNIPLLIKYALVGVSHPSDVNTELVCLGHTNYALLYGQ